MERNRFITEKERSFILRILLLHSFKILNDVFQHKYFYISRKRQSEEKYIYELRAISENALES